MSKELESKLSELQKALEMSKAKAEIEMQKAKVQGEDKLVIGRSDGSLLIIPRKYWANKVTTVSNELDIKVKPGGEKK